MVKTIITIDEVSEFTPEQQEWIASLPVRRFEDEISRLLDESAESPD